MTFRDGLLPMLDSIRGIPNELGLRLFTVTVVVRTWSGSRVGLGTKTDVETELTVAGDAAPIRVRSLKSQEVIASGGLYTSQDFKAGPMTPAYPGGGVDIATILPAPTATPTEVLWRIEGPGMASDGTWFTQIDNTSDANLHYYVILRATGAPAV